MPQLLADFWLPSDNLMGELFLKELGVRHNGEPGTYAMASPPNAHILRLSAWTMERSQSPTARVPRHTISSRRAISSRFCKRDWNGGQRDDVIAALPKRASAARSRTAFPEPLERTSLCENGNETHIRALSGYLQTARHGPVTFSLIINDWMGDRRPIPERSLRASRSDLLLPFIPIVLPVNAFRRRVDIRSIVRVRSRRA